MCWGYVQEIAGKSHVCSPKTRFRGFAPFGGGGGGGGGGEKVAPVRALKCSKDLFALPAARTRKTRLNHVWNPRMPD